MKSCRCGSKQALCKCSEELLCQQKCQELRACRQTPLWATVLRRTPFRVHHGLCEMRESGVGVREDAGLWPTHMPAALSSGRLSDMHDAGRGDVRVWQYDGVLPVQGVPTGPSTPKCPYLCQKPSHCIMPKFGPFLSSRRMSPCTPSLQG